MADNIDPYTGQPKVFSDGQPFSYSLSYDDNECGEGACAKDPCDEPSYVSRSKFFCYDITIRQNLTVRQNLRLTGDLVVSTGDAYLAFKPTLVIDYLTNQQYYVLANGYVPPLSPSSPSTSPVIESETAPVSSSPGALWWQTASKVLSIRTLKNTWERVTEREDQVLNAGTF